jgi:hypothetical protein
MAPVMEQTATTPNGRNDLKLAVEIGRRFDMMDFKINIVIFLVVFLTVVVIWKL